MLDPKKYIRLVRWRVAAEAERFRVLLGGGLFSSNFPSPFFRCILHVNPQKILWRCKLRSKEQTSRRMFPDGDWDLMRESMAFYESYDYRYISCRQIINEGLGFRETEEYSFYIDKIGGGGLARGMSSIQDVEVYMALLERFYREVELSRQLKSQVQLGESPLCGEINFVIGRDGELLKADDGNHRFAIARVCGLTRIPIQVSMIHPLLVRDLLKGADNASVVHAVNTYLRDVESVYV